mmetsp:Transcript_33396/g.95685  ORF Transcript_33396/g.95685 Transcript_33396/m.95685 type:complete len:292 (+) Transcript_33396:21-896(+)
MTILASGSLSEIAILGVWQGIQRVIQRRPAWCPWRARGGDRRQRPLAVHLLPGFWRGPRTLARVLEPLREAVEVLVAGVKVGPELRQGRARGPKVALDLDHAAVKLPGNVDHVCLQPLLVEGVRVQALAGLLVRGQQAHELLLGRVRALLETLLVADQPLAARGRLLDAVAMPLVAPRELGDVVRRGLQSELEVVDDLAAAASTGRLLHAHILVEDVHHLFQSLEVLDILPDRFGKLHVLCNERLDAPADAILGIQYRPGLLEEGCGQPEFCTLLLREIPVRVHGVLNLLC